MGRLLYTKAATDEMATFIISCALCFGQKSTQQHILRLYKDSAAIQKKRRGLLIKSALCFGQKGVLLVDDIINATAYSQILQKQRHNSKQKAWLAE